MSETPLQDHAATDVSAPSVSAPTPASKPGNSLESLRIQFGKTVGCSYWILVVSIPLLILLLMALLSGLITNDTIDRLALSASLQVGLGMYLGFMSLYFGVMMTWLGIESAFDLSGKGSLNGKDAQVTLSSASPGIFFGLIGAVLVVMCLYKTIEFKDTGMKPIPDILHGQPKRSEPAGDKYKPDSSSKPEEGAKQTIEGTTGK